MEAIISGINWLDDFIWGMPMIVLLLGTHLFMTVRTGFIQRKTFTGNLLSVRKDPDAPGDVSQFQALTTALASTIGTGNIVGVATAIVAGGPGAMFWMWLAALFGMATKYSEGLLAVKYRSIDEDGHVLRGPFYYLERGMKQRLPQISWRWLAKIFAFFGVCLVLFGIGTFSQVNGISSAVHGFFDPNDAFTVKILQFIGEYSWSVVIASLILSFCVAAVLIGGVKRIASVSQIIIPFMAVIYFVFAVILICCNITKVPAAFATIVTAAFSPKAITGGAVGSMLIAMQKGVARGIFSNEAGLGSAPIAAAAAQTNSPVRQGLVSMTGTFIDTIIICTLTGLSIVLTGAWQVEGLEGVQVTTYAFQHGLPFPAQFSSFILMLCLVFFAFTTILGWDYYSERCLEYLSGGNMKHVKIFRWIYILAVFIGPYMTVSAVWTIADIFNGLMAIPNMIALFALSGVIVKETRAFFQHAHEEARAEHRSFEEVCEESLNEEEAPAN